MNTIKMEDQNRIDDLQIQRAISGLTEQQFATLCDLVGRQSQDASDAPQANDDSGEEFTGFDECVALVDVWMASDSDVTLSADMRRQLLDKFAGGSPDRNLSQKHRVPVRSRRRWFYSVALAAAVICLTLASVAWITRPGPDGTRMQFSAAELRKQMLADPPEDMLRWGWMGNLAMEPENAEKRFLGDVIWSDRLQLGYALMNVHSPISDPSLYQLRLFQQLEDQLGPGILCGEFRFDGYSEPFVIVIRPESEVASPQRFVVNRSPDEPQETAGPSANEEIELLAEANPDPQMLTDHATSEGGNAVISNEEESTTF